MDSGLWICKVHNQEITNICTHQHNCPDRRLCNQCIFGKIKQHPGISIKTAPLLSDFREDVIQKLKNYGIYDNQQQILQHFKQFENYAQKVLKEFFNSIKCLISLLQKVKNEVIQLTNNIQEEKGLQKCDLNKLVLIACRINVLDQEQVLIKQCSQISLDNANLIIENANKYFTNVETFSKNFSLDLKQKLISSIDNLFMVDTSSGGNDPKRMQQLKEFLQKCEFQKEILNQAQKESETKQQQYFNPFYIPNIMQDSRIIAKNQKDENYQTDLQKQQIPQLARMESALLQQCPPPQQSRNQNNQIPQTRNQLPDNKFNYPQDDLYVTRNYRKPQEK